MITETQYRERLKELLGNSLICKENRELFHNFFEHEEYKLRRTNGINRLDDGTLKTLSGYIHKLKNINNWFKNKPLKEVTKEDIKKVYDGLEDGEILNKNNKPFKDRKSYYNKIFKSKLFQMIGKADLSREVMEFYRPSDDQEVRFIRDKTVRQLVNVIINIRHKAFTWLSFDIGENVNSLLKLRKCDCMRQINEVTKTPEYRINFDKSILKRTRTARNEITNYQETVELLDIILKDLKDDELIFPFKYSMTKKFLTRAVRITGAKCIPKGQPITWKDLRSSMACDLLSKGWTTDEVNGRLGHKPSSREIDKYINFLALDKKQPKKKLYDNNLSRIQAELEESKEREKLQAQRIESLRKNFEDNVGTMKEEIVRLQNVVGFSKFINRTLSPKNLAKIEEENKRFNLDKK